MIKIAVPNKGSLSEAAVEILAEAGYKGRGHSKALNVVDPITGSSSFSCGRKISPSMSPAGS